MAGELQASGSPSPEADSGPQGTRPQLSEGVGPVFGAIAIPVYEWSDTELRLVPCQPCADVSGKFFPVHDWVVAAWQMADASHKGSTSYRQGRWCVRTSIFRLPIYADIKTASCNLRKRGRTSLGYTMQNREPLQPSDAQIDGVPLLIAPRLDPIGIGLTKPALQWFTNRVGVELNAQAGAALQESPPKPAPSGLADKVMSCLTQEDLDELREKRIKVWPSRGCLVAPLSEADQVSAGKRTAGKMIKIIFPRSRKRSNNRRKRAKVRKAVLKAKDKAIAYVEQGWVASSSGSGTDGTSGGPDSDSPSAAGS